MHKSQLELLLNQIYDCSIAINNVLWLDKKLSNYR